MNSRRDYVNGDEYRTRTTQSRELCWMSCQRRATASRKRSRSNDIARYTAVAEVGDRTGRCAPRNPKTTAHHPIHRRPPRSLRSRRSYSRRAEAHIVDL
jgi:hypothetical protein